VALARPFDVLEAPIPRPLLWIGAPIAGLLLIVVFVFLRFPYDEFAAPLGQRLGEATGSEVVIGGIEPRITIGGPGIAARDVRIVRPDGRWIEIDPLRIRPAWSTAWLNGDPALKIDVDSTVGRSSGMLVLGDPPAWVGEVEDVDLARLPLGSAGGVAVSGLLVAAADLALGPGVPTGPLSFDAHTGEIAHPALPIVIDYDRASGDLTLGADPIVEVRALEIDGPVLHASASGNVRIGRGPGDEQLDLEIEVEIKDPAMRAMLQGLGVRLDGRGRAKFALGGTLASPRPR
jgi:type II secretion system protein N